MRQLLKQILIIMSAVMLIIASGGFNLYQRYCICTNEIDHSIVIESPVCYEDIITCTSDECCETESDHNNRNNDCGSTDNCCTTEYTFLKTDIFDFTIDQKKPLKLTSGYVLIPEDVVNNKEYPFHKKYTFAADLPPPEYGKELLISLQQIKISIHLV